jgi:4-hydroxybutyrate CoA-transferase
MSWSETYAQKLTTADRAVELIRSDDRVYVHPGCAAPVVLTKALLKRAESLENVELVHLLTFGPADYTLPQYDGHFRHNGLFLGANVREAVAAGRADYTPIMLSEIEKLFCSGELPLDVVLLQTSPPDEYGYLSLGVGVDCTLNAARCAKHVIAEVNQQMPRTMGDSFLHVTRVSAIVETNRPLLELKPEPYTDLQRRIGENVASLIPDGATLQLGIGGIPDAALACLRDRHDLGVHSEMCSDGVVPLIEAGIINGERKSCSGSCTTILFLNSTPSSTPMIHLSSHRTRTWWRSTRQSKSI